MKEVFQAIQDDEADFVGILHEDVNGQEQIYFFAGKYYSILAAGRECWLIEETLTEIGSTCPELK